MMNPSYLSCSRVSLRPSFLSCNDSIRIYTNALNQSEHIISQSLSLHDPISLQRIEVPCRSFDCQHLQCFDYTIMSSLKKEGSDEKSFFRCPVCNEFRNPENVYRDFIAFGFLKMFKTSESVTIFRNGKFQAFEAISPEFDAINSIFDMAQLCKLESFASSTITLEQLSRTRISDIVHILNKLTDQELLDMILQRSKPNVQKATLILNSIDRSRPFHATTWLGLKSDLRRIDGVGALKGDKIINDLIKEHAGKSKIRLESMSSGPLTMEENQKSILDPDACEDVLISIEVVDMTCDDDDDDDVDNVNNQSSNVPVNPFIVPPFSSLFPSTSLSSSSTISSPSPHFTTTPELPSGIITLSNRVTHDAFVNNNNRNGNRQEKVSQRNDQSISNDNANNHTLIPNPNFPMGLNTFPSNDVNQRLLSVTDTHSGNKSRKSNINDGSNKSNSCNIDRYS